MVVNENTLLSSVRVNQNFTDRDIQKTIVKDLEKVYNTLTADNSSAVDRIAELEAPTGVTAGTYGSETLSPQIVIDANGRITSAVNKTISGGGGSTQGYTDVFLFMGA